MVDKSPEQQFVEEQARLAISQPYLARDDNPDLDPGRQDQIDRNRLPEELSEAQLSPGSAVRSRAAAADDAQRGGSLTDAVSQVLDSCPYATLAFAALAGIVLGAIWKA